jgi:hypothetical protein
MPTRGRPGSRRSCTEERGQALVELVIASLLLVPLLLVAYHMSRLLYARLELISLTREAALFMIHESKSEISADVLAAFARQGRLDPSHLSAELAAASLGSQSAAAPTGFQGILSKFLLGSRLTLRYKIYFSGLGGKLLPEGLELTETVVFQSGTWKNLGLGELKSILF